MQRLSSLIWSEIFEKLRCRGRPCVTSTDLRHHRGGTGEGCSHDSALVLQDHSWNTSRASTDRSRRHTNQSIIVSTVNIPKSSNTKRYTTTSESSDLVHFHVNSVAFWWGTFINLSNLAVWSYPCCARRHLCLTYLSTLKNDYRFVFKKETLCSSLSGLERRGAPRPRNLTVCTWDGEGIGGLLYKESLLTHKNSGFRETHELWVLLDIYLHPTRSSTND